MFKLSNQRFASKFLVAFFCLALFSFCAVTVSAQFGPTPTFASPVSYPLPYWSNYDTKMAVGDFDNDGNMDIALLPGTNTTWSVFVFMNNGAGGFHPRLEFNRARGFAVADFDHDGTDDLILDDRDRGFHIWYGDTLGYDDPSFMMRDQVVGFSPCSGPRAWEMATGDFNGDGHPDVFYGALDCIAVHLGDGNAISLDPSFTDGYQGARWGLFGTEVADFDGDENLDVLTPNSTTFLGNGSGSLAVSDYQVGLDVFDEGSVPFTVGDFNNDQRPDIADIGLFDFDIGAFVYLNNGTGSFDFSWDYTPGHWSTDIKNADVNSDGNLDIVTVGGDLLSVYLGAGDGTFGPSIDFPGVTSYSGQRMVIADFNNDGKPDIVTTEGDGIWDHSIPHPASSHKLWVFLNTTYQTSIGVDVPVQVGDTSFTFDNVTTGGTTSVTSIDPATAGEVTGGFALADLAFEVSTTATFTGSVTTCFNVPMVNDQTEFLNLRVLHNENGTLVDRTSSHDYPNRKICATTTSFSPFYLATVGKKVQSLFDRSRAFKSGSTVPVKVKILDGSDQNISSATLPLTARALRRIGSNTTSDVMDAGNSNPDFTFRYDSGLQGYIYNLKTTGLAAGRYVLSFYAGSDRAFFYTVEFEVK